jgi:thioredoxin reductase (NADPH)
LFINVMWRELDMLIQQRPETGTAPAQTLDDIFASEAWRTEMIGAGMDERLEQAIPLMARGIGAKWWTSAVRMVICGRVRTAAQMARIAAHGRRRSIIRGEVLVEVGDKGVPFFVVVSGEIQILRPSTTSDTLIVAHAPGQFLGEGNMITGRRALVRAFVSESGEVIELDRQQLLALVQTDAELSEILMRAFILRRSELIAAGLGDVVLIGSTHCAGTLRVKELLTRNGHPYHYIDLDRDTDAQELLDRFHVSAADVPVLICRGDAVLRNPTNR